MGDLRDYFDTNEGKRIHKWDHFFPIFEELFERFRNRPACILEIGVGHGGSLQMWKHYFGDLVSVVGADIRPRCKAFEEERVEVRIGDQSDPDFLSSLIAEFGPFDIVIDDGGHNGKHQALSLRAFLPEIKVGGLYLCEDMHTGYGSQGNRAFLVQVMKCIDQMHAWVNTGHRGGFQRMLKGVRVYPALVVVERGDEDVPTHTATGYHTCGKYKGKLATDEHASGATPIKVGRK